MSAQTEPIIAYRAWDVKGDALDSCAQDCAWPKMQPLRASCLRSAPHSLLAKLRRPVMPSSSFAMVCGGIGAALSVSVIPIDIIHGSLWWAPLHLFLAVVNAALGVLNWRGLRARKRHAQMPVSGAPVYFCGCGIYCFKDEATLARSGYGSRGIIGRVAIWGKIVEHEDGYRAEFAYPQVFYLRGNDMDDRTHEVAREYGVDCVQIPESLKNSVSSTVAYLTMGGGLTAGQMNAYNAQFANLYNQIAQMPLMNVGNIASAGNPPQFQGPYGQGGPSPWQP